MKVDPKKLNKKQLHELFVSAVLPRPIAFVSTVGEDGVFNLAPYSFFVPLCLRPAVVALSIEWKRDGRKKDTLRNIEFSNDFVVNVVTENLAKAMNQTSFDYDSGVDEFKEVGLTPMKADLVKAPLVAESPVNLECKALQIIKFGEAPTGTNVIIAEVILVHVNEDVWTGDHIDILKSKVIGRLGEELYCRTADTFEMKRPK